MAKPDAIFKDGAYMNASEGQMYIGVYRYPPSYSMSSTCRYCDICIDDRHL